VSGCSNWNRGARRGARAQGVTMGVRERSRQVNLEGYQRVLAELRRRALSIARLLPGSRMQSKRRECY
jgi:hypothetical protein